MANIRQVARHAKVSIATVSRVLNGHESVAPELRKRVLTAAEACDYSPTATRRQTEHIALLYAGIATPAGPYDSACIGGMVEALEQAPFDLVVLNHLRDRQGAETFRQFLKRKQVAGVVVRCTEEHRNVATEIADSGVPTVVLGDHFDHPSLCFSYCDCRAASEEAVDYLCSLGHTRIAFATCERDDGDHVDRLRAYQSVLEAHGLYDPTLVYRIPPHRLDGAQLMRAMMGVRNRPTAAFIADPLVAVGAIVEAQSMGVRIPEDFSIIGVDDTDTRTAVYPRMTAVCQDSASLGRQAVALLCRTVLEGAPLEAVEREPSRAPQAWLEINHNAGPPPEVVSRVLPNGARL